MAGKCTAGKINCQHFNIKTGKFIGCCNASDQFLERVILTTDSQCPCPQLQKVVESKGDKAWKVFESLWNNSNALDLNTTYPFAKAQFKQSILESKLEDD